MSEVDRRGFLEAVPAAAYALARGPWERKESRGPTRHVVEPFDYRGVRLLPSPWERQYRKGRDFYFGLSDDDILHGFRKAAGRPAPGRPLGGWCGIDSATVFGQWLSGMARMSAATGDSELRDKALGLFSDWTKCIPPSGDCGMGHYRYDKLVGGLVDLGLYAGNREAVAVLERVTDFAIQNLERPESGAIADPSHNQRYYGVPQEWYTLGENLFRAYRLTGEPRFRSFAGEWLYHAYWAKFREKSSPKDAHGVHAYSHVNTFSSASMAYEVTGDPSFLAAARNACEYLEEYQCYATGGYGPNERFMAPGGSLGRALETRSDTFECSCGSWAAFKLASYLMSFTGEARYGDWIERLFYNGVGAALPITGGGRNFYYADYRLGGGMKVHNWDRYTCCSGTYIQNLAAYHDLIYFTDGAGLYVNLYVPSEVTWGDVKLRQETRYPDSEATTLTVTTAEPRTFPLRFRVPSWTLGVSARVNGVEMAIQARPGEWASVSRTWASGDRLEIRIPLALRMEAVDTQHRDRVAIVRGPAVLVLEGAYHDPNFRLPSRDEELETWLVPEEGTLPRGVWSVGPETEAQEYATSFRVEPPGGSAVRLRFRPFYEIAENYPYFMYFDRERPAGRLW